MVTLVAFVVPVYRDLPRSVVMPLLLASAALWFNAVEVLSSLAAFALSMVTLVAFAMMAFVVPAALRSRSFAGHVAVI
jgi:hypothetical protein